MRGGTLDPMKPEESRVVETFKELKAAILKRYPPLSSLSRWQQVKARLRGARRQVSQVRTTAIGVFAQDAVVVTWLGADYTLRFGKLEK